MWFLGNDFKTSGATCIGTLAWISLLASSVCIDLVSSAARSLCHWPKDWSPGLSYKWTGRTDRSGSYSKSSECLIRDLLIRNYWPCVNKFKSISQAFDCSDCSGANNHHKQGPNDHLVLLFPPLGRNLCASWKWVWNLYLGIYTQPYPVGKISYFFPNRSFVLLKTISSRNHNGRKNLFTFFFRGFSYFPGGFS